MRNVCYDKKTIFLTEIRAIFDDNLFFDGLSNGALLTFKTAPLCIGYTI